MSTSNKNLANTREVKEGLLDVHYIARLFEEKSDISYIHHKDNPVLLGTEFLLKVNTSIGISKIEGYEDEIAKIVELRDCPFLFKSDLIMDHTPRLDIAVPIWKTLVKETDKPIGTVPVYSVFKENKGINRNELLEQIEEMAGGGIAFMTFHPTATLELYELAKTTRGRSNPSTSWGGVDVLSDCLLNRRNANIIEDCFDEILAILKKHNVTMSIGSVFRPSGISEALDAIHVRETIEQKTFIDRAKMSDVNVIMEGIGHIRYEDIARYCNLIKDHGAPLMPLGPMITDASIGFDHVAAAIGAREACARGNIGIVNSVTRVEHLGGVPTVEDVIEGLKSALVVAHSVNISRFPSYKTIDDKISIRRSLGASCVVDGGLFGIDAVTSTTGGCSRCDKQCPLRIRAG
jgi:phosphomethylpyrimidine synthase